MSDFSIRPAGKDEYGAVGDLTVAGYDADGHLTHPDGHFDERYASWLRDGHTRGRDGALMVAVDADVLLGTVTWCPVGSPFRELAQEDSQGEFRSLSVSPAARGRGVGRALVRWCIDEAASTELDQIVICSLPSMLPAHNLYRTMGFLRRADLDWSPFAGVDLWGFSLDMSRRSRV